MNNQAPKISTTFSAKNTGDSSKIKSPSYDSGYDSSSASSKSSLNQNWKDSPNLNTDFVRQHMSFLASILESYESLVAGKISNQNMTEDYDQVDQEEMELMDISWCMASVIKRAQWFMEITGRKCREGLDIKLGFDKAKVTCFKCKQKGNFKTECTNRQADDSVNPFHEDYYKKAIYHRTNEQPSRTNQNQIDEGPSKQRKQALLTSQEDEGFNWNKYISKEKFALVAEMRQS
ncbi:putative transcription factor interactor and regulator CCHC(Zn) family [Helianthus annuus]|nr:putative transcription factor interactor and regulator CCHC(Zn) family [Helianthus annuus]KAJ0555066.1 putative transcription factor interactor and regulator CCHC(Zn) family [Helianthus annuus]KAJ0723823.1 putative transcription factor interactor and regulator CCHC(Zn) family [Helianthus annuus]